MKPPKFVLIQPHFYFQNSASKFEELTTKVHDCYIKKKIIHRIIVAFNFSTKMYTRIMFSIFD